MASFKNGSKDSHPTLDPDIVKVVVVGEPKCGKTRFIRAFYDQNDQGETYSYNGVKVYPCRITIRSRQMRSALIEIPSDPDFPVNQKLPLYKDANVIIFMYAIDNPLSFEMLSEKWLKEAGDIIKSNVIPVALVGTKKDLQEDQQVVQRLALDNQTPVSYWKGKELFGKLRGSFNGVAFLECSGNDLEDVYGLFDLIFEYALSDE